MKNVSLKTAFIISTLGTEWHSKQPIYYGSFYHWSTVFICVFI